MPPVVQRLTPSTDRFPRPHPRQLAAVFSMQGVGQLVCAVLLIIVAYSTSDPNVQWRVALAFGAVPMILIFTSRWRMHETEAWQSAVASLSYRERVRKVLQDIWQYKFLLAGTAGCWFILDILFYGNSLFSAGTCRAVFSRRRVESRVEEQPC